MTETLENAETQATGLGALLQQWGDNPPQSLSVALQEAGQSVEALEEYARSGISTEDLEALRKVLVAGASSGNPEDGKVLAQLTPVLDPRERSWDRVIRAKTTNETLTAIVTEAVKGGVVVDLGIRGFVPSSQIGLSVPKNLNQYVGQTLKLRVLEVDRRRQTVILTNRQVVEEERAQKRKQALSKLSDGEERKGTVRRLTDIGAFVDVGGIDGLLHVSEISWKRVEHPSDVLKVGQKINVKVLRVDPQTGRVSLSMRQLAPDPWDEARRKYAIGTVVNVKIIGTVPQGAVVELEEGLDGFIPISELANRRVATVEEVVQVGAQLDALVIDIRPRERRVVFSIRKLEQKKERQVVETYQKKVQTTSRSERTTLGDLFGHLFEEYRQPEETPAEEESVTPVDAEDETEAPVAVAGSAEVETPVGTEAEEATEGAVEAEAAETEAAEEAVDSTEAPADELAVDTTEAGDSSAADSAGSEDEVAAPVDEAPVEEAADPVGEPIAAEPDAEANPTGEDDESAA